MSNTVSAFSEDQVSRLTGLTVGQLRSWNRTGFIQPEYLNKGARTFSRIYSFRDLLRLRILNQLRNVYRVPMHELRRVSKELEHLGDEKWTSQRLWVLNRRVVFEEPESSRKREIASKQYIAEIPLSVVTSDARSDISKMNQRDDVAGEIVKKRQLHSSEEVFSGTRIPVTAIEGYIEAGFDDSEILRRFPTLLSEDIDAARARHDHKGAA
ncbi:DUF433 domain-containing protein [Frigidibacter sp. ROC022]|uniref:DUF433 domain-containing protein n=1 Tax=Frigidibacter sp. ROC022 TaxID=2971796 RepID=UPI00215A2C7C|nr:DUF433 domain-containing protein [Frigidibacter sp. ROC022]MCR8722734.1 DUF433 domain-containing protein [Frigidibacter sp. ROC022]